MSLTPTTYLYDDRAPVITTGAQITLLDMSQEQKDQAAERERARPPFGFARAAAQPDRQ